MGLCEKTFPIRMDNETYARLQKQAKQNCMSITGYIRSAFMDKIIHDEATDTAPVKKKRGQ